MNRGNLHFVIFPSIVTSNQNRQEDGDGGRSGNVFVIVSGFFIVIATFILILIFSVDKNFISTFSRQTRIGKRRARVGGVGIGTGGENIAAPTSSSRHQVTRAASTPTAVAESWRRSTCPKILTHIFSIILSQKL